MATFWRLLEESVIIQGTITLVLIAAMVFLAVTGREVPDVLSSSTALALGFYFGSKSEQIVQARTGKH